MTYVLTEEEYQALLNKGKAVAQENCSDAKQIAKAIANCMNVKLAMPLDTFKGVPRFYITVDADSLPEKLSKHLISKAAH